MKKSFYFHPLYCVQRSVLGIPMNLGGEKKRNMNAGKTRLKSTAVYGRTIFWKETK